MAVASDVLTAAAAARAGRAEDHHSMSPTAAAAANIGRTVDTFDAQVPLGCREIFALPRAVTVVVAVTAVVAVLTAAVGPAVAVAAARLNPPSG